MDDREGAGRRLRPLEALSLINPHRLNGAVNMNAISRALTVLAVLGIVLALSAPVSAADETHTGKVKSASATQLVLTVQDKDHTFKIDDMTKITLDGKESKAADLKAGQSCTVTAKQSEGGGFLATRISATSA